MEKKMKTVHTNLFMAVALATSVTVSVPTIALAAKDGRHQCALDEKWDKKEKKCVEKSSY